MTSHTNKLREQKSDYDIYKSALFTRWPKFQMCSDHKDLEPLESCYVTATSHTLSPIEELVQKPREIHHGDSQQDSRVASDLGQE